MRCECPVFMRCCFCFPLRYGLLVFSYVKQIMNLLLLTFMFVTLSKQGYRKNLSGWDNVLPALSIIFVILDIGFTLLFIIGGHSKNYKKMRIFYRYSIAVQCVYAGHLSLLIAHCVYYSFMRHYAFIQEVRSIWEPLLMTDVSIIVIQLYIIILVRSEFLKLKNNTQFEFVNREAEENCTANIEFGKGIPDSV